MNKHKLLISLGVLLAFASIVSCGPSPEAAATMTASVWTPTPEPTLTPTPLPFDLEVTLKNEDGETVTYEAYVSAPGYDKELVYESGKAILLNLPGPEVEISAYAQGYQTITEVVNLENGKNAIDLTLLLDPLQVNPATACPDGQEILLIEDFEDGEAQGWEDLVRPLWTLEEFEGMGTVLLVNSLEQRDVYSRIPVRFGNGVWHFDILRTPELGQLWLRFHIQKPLESYLVYFAGQKAFQLAYEPGGKTIASHQLAPNDGETWEHYSIAYFDGAVDIYRDNELWLGVDVKNPVYSSGTASIDSAYSKVRLDNMVFCSLSEPYVPPVSEEVMEE